ncbi:RNA polymerase sigma factor [Asticcacaulis taihuensis]|jgi:RNA polymerase sigma-70 factor (ECF subfamily)|uniref:RNA polymerase sigma-70 factor, ECF subfamily n=1 Tax=Asticcacaulis taihuensis TaxID=260084 RepID=A0A1G4Q0X3_9CAUL|nr:RNA polymerase sigma factor [Asticcacaulis taihuensis]SCW38233.1 RNA polymerase sigma-70 factor, ECF subfamily [Asticcacaulis taihuensis]
MEDPLIRRAREGSSDAFSRLVADHQQAVRAFVRRLCAQPDDADDLAQEAFVTAWAILHKLRDDVSFRTFVCGIAYRKALNDRRRLNRSGARDTEWFGLQEQSRPSTIDAKLSVQAALASLPLDQRAAISLCVAADYSHAEAAEILGLPLGTIKSHILKGRAKLNALLGVPDDK